ncbi:MAG TPA: hypothetical protein VF407_25485 [Polyangiaceae bacterium]
MPAAARSSILLAIAWLGACGAKPVAESAKPSASTLPSAPVTSELVPVDASTPDGLAVGDAGHSEGGDVRACTWPTKVSADAKPCTILGEGPLAAAVGTHVRILGALSSTSEWATLQALETPALHVRFDVQPACNANGFLAIEGDLVRDPDAPMEETRAGLLGAMGSGQQWSPLVLTRAKVDGPPEIACAGYRPPFDHRAAKAAIAAVSLKGCGPHEPDQALQVAVDFTPSGKVTKVELDGHASGGNSTMRCIRERLEKIRVAPFRGPSAPRVSHELVLP